jgi:hypothetical protein
VVIASVGIGRVGHEVPPGWSVIAGSEVRGAFRGLRIVETTT